jgi:hypothetical protein
LRHNSPPRLQRFAGLDLDRDGHAGGEPHSAAISQKTYGVWDKRDRNDDACSAALRKQSRHRQSPSSSGIGSRAVSSAHQHGPARLQLNSVPHPEQARRREAGFSNRFVINRRILNVFFIPGSCRTAV